MDFTSEKENQEDWLKVLELMYEEKIIADPDISPGFINEKDAQKFLPPAMNFYGKVEPQINSDVEQVIDYLEELGLITVNRKTDVPIPGLTQEGLQFAHQIKTERQRRNTNIILLVLTAILTVLTVVLVVAELGFI
jgi:hypothetical protein